VTSNNLGRYTLSSPLGEYGEIATASFFKVNDMRLIVLDFWRNEVFCYEDMPGNLTDRQIRKFLKEKQYNPSLRQIRWLYGNFDISYFNYKNIVGETA
jgi:hypothetical protein